MSTIGTHIIKLVEDTGRTIFLALSTTGTAKFSLTGTSWFPLSQDSSQGSNSYVFDNGLVEQSGVVSIDENKVPLLVEGSLPDKYTPGIPKSMSTGLEMTNSGQLRASSNIVPGNILVLPIDGSLPRDIIPVEDPVKYVGGTGIQVIGNVISEQWVDYRK